MKVKISVGTERVNEMVFNPSGPSFSTLNKVKFVWLALGRVNTVLKVAVGAEGVKMECHFLFQAKSYT